MKMIIRIGLLACLLLLKIAPFSSAAVRITNMAVAPWVLMEIYKAWEQRRSQVPLLSSRIFYMAVEADEQADSFKFRFEIRDGDTLIASLDFQTTTPVAPGRNVFNAGQISTLAGNDIYYNDKYINATDVTRMLQGQDSQIRGDFRLVVTPLNPEGASYIVPYAMFAPVSSQNSPVRVIYPNNIVVDTLLPVFSWSPAKGAVFYEILVSPEQDPAVNTYWSSGKIRATQKMYPSSARALEDGEKYYWQIIAYDEFSRPIGGLNGKSMPAWFRINSTAKVSTAVTPAEADAALRVVIKDKKVFEALKEYRPMAVETTAPDLADLLRQLREGSARVTAYNME